jgi:hypothetical protein
VQAIFDALTGEVGSRSVARAPRQTKSHPAIHLRETFKIVPMGVSLSEFIVTLEVVPSEENILLRDGVPEFRKEINRLFDFFCLRHAIRNFASKSSGRSLFEFAKGRYWKSNPFFDTLNSISEDEQTPDRQIPSS